MNMPHLPRHDKYSDKIDSACIVIGSIIGVVVIMVICYFRGR
jgi:hypothetical protein